MSMIEKQATRRGRRSGSSIEYSNVEVIGRTVQPAHWQRALTRSPGPTQPLDHQVASPRGLEPLLPP